MKGLLLYNTKAGKGRTVSNVAAIVEVFRREGIAIEPKEIAFGQNPFDGHEDVDLAVVAGGDGTINYVVNCMFDRGVNPTLGIIPDGTANDFANAIGMKKGVIDDARQIAQGRERMVDCGEVNGLRFVNVFSFGVLTTTSQQTPDKAKHRFGKLAYLWVGAKDLARMHPIELTVTTDSERFECNASMLLVFNGRSAGRFRLAPKAEVDDGMFDVVLLEHRNVVVSCWKMLRYLVGGVPKGVRVFRSNNLSIDSKQSELTDVDGQRGPLLPVELRCLSQRLCVRG